MSSYLDRCFRSIDGQRLITAHLIKRFQHFIFLFRFKQWHVNCNQLLNWLHDQWATELRIHSSLLWISCLIWSISWSVSPRRFYIIQWRFHIIRWKGSLYKWLIQFSSILYAVKMYIYAFCSMWFSMSFYVDTKLRIFDIK